MKKKSVIFPILSIFLLIVPSGIQADQISKNSVILKEVKEVKTAEGVTIFLMIQLVKGARSRSGSFGQLMVSSPTAAALKLR
jgi:hypothetical protein